MPDERASIRETEETPYRRYVKDLIIHISSCDLDMQTLLKKEKFRDKTDLIMSQGLRLFGGMCQLTDDLISQELTKQGWDQLVGIGQFVDRLTTKEAVAKDKRTGIANEVIEDLSGEKITKKTVEAINEIEREWEPLMEGLQTLTKKDEGEYDPKEITLPKLKFVWTALAVAQQGVVNLLPQGISTKENEKLRKLLESNREYFDKEKKPLKKSRGTKAVETIAIGCLTLGALGLGIWGYDEFANRGQRGNELKTFVQNIWSEATGGRARSALEAGRNDRYEQYLNSDEKKPTVAKVLKSGLWPDDTAEDIIGYLDPYTYDYNQWMAFPEWCGPQCFLNPSWIPAGRGQTEIMDLLGLTETEYQDYYQHPEKWPDLIDHLRDIYPDKPWLADLFSIRPTRPDLEGKSDFELWREKYKLQGKVDNGITLSMLGKPIIRNQWGGAEQRLDRQQPWNRQANIKGRGFGSTKGFS